MRIRVVTSGRNYEAASQWPSELELPSDATTGDALALLRERVPELLHDSMLILLDGRHLGTVAQHTATPLSGGAELELVAPVAGG